MPVDEVALKANLPILERHLTIFDEALAESRFVAGDALCLADLFVLPIIPYLGMVSESQPMLKQRTRLMRWQDVMLARQSAPATEPKLAA